MPPYTLAIGLRIWSEPGGRLVLPNELTISPLHEPSRPPKPTRLAKMIESVPKIFGADVGVDGRGGGMSSGPGEFMVPPSMDPSYQVSSPAA